MSYTMQTLLPNENILYFIKPHYIIFYQTLVLLVFAIFISVTAASVFLGGILLIMSFFNFINLLISYSCSEYAITNKRIIMKTGFISRKSLEIFLNRVEGIYIDQGIAGRYLNFGTITVVGTGGTKNSFYYIPEPLKFRNTVQEIMEQNTPLLLIKIPPML